MQILLFFRQLQIAEKTVKSALLTKVRDVDFTERFSTSIETLMKMLGTTRKIEKKVGEVLKAYKVKGTLEDGKVAEGEVVEIIVRRL